MDELMTSQATADSLTVYLSCEIDHHTARRLRERIDGELFVYKPRLLVFDFSGVRFMDSSGIGLIMGRLAAMSAIGGTLRLEGLSPSLSKLIRLSGIEKMRGITVASPRGNG